MRRSILLVMILIAAMISVSFVHATGPVQPPVSTDTLYVGANAWGPFDADPCYAYDTASGGLLFNVYDTLIQGGNATWGTSETYWEFIPLLSANVPDREVIELQLPDAGINVSDPVSYWTEVGSTWYHIEDWLDAKPLTLGAYDILYIGEYEAQGQPIQDAVTVRAWQVADYSPTTLTLHRYVYEFSIRTDPFITFYDSALNPVDTFDVEDARYSLQRGLVQDQLGSPMWLFYEAYFGRASSWDFGNANTEDGAWMLSKLIDSSVNATENTLQLNLGTAFPESEFKQLLSETWGSILSREWCIGKGCWNGDLFVDNAPVDGIPDWYENLRDTTAPIDTVNTTNYAGTGPYVTSVIDHGSNLVVLQRNPNYWRSWSMVNRPFRKTFLEYVNIEYISTWSSRRDAFTAGQLDICAVSNRYESQLLNSYGDPLYPTIETIKNLQPIMSMNALFYTFTINQTSTHIYTGRLPDGIPTNFFNITEVRKAFSYAFNHTAYFAQACYGEATVRETPSIAGLYPDYYNYAPDPPWTYDINTAKIIQNLQAAMFMQDGVTKSLWDWGGFKLDAPYVASADPPTSSQIAAQIIQNSFAAINSQYGKNFTVNPVAVTSGTYRDGIIAFKLPLWQMGWQSDIADASDWYRVFMKSNGDFSGLQNYSEANGWTTRLGSRTGLNKDVLVERAARTESPSEAAMMYADLQEIYLADNPSLPTDQPTGRKWLQYWVKGWEYNALWPSDYYYHLYKADECWGSVTGPTPGVSDGVCSMRDLGLVASKFGARAPDTSRTPPYDPKWAPGTYSPAGADVYGDRRVDMRDIGFMCHHFGHTSQP